MALRTLAALFIAGGLAAPALAQSPQLRPAQDDSWCNKDDSGWGRGSRTCAVFEASWAAGGPISVDASPNGGIKVSGWDRNEIRLRAKLVTQADDDGAARELASGVQIHAGAKIYAEGPESGRNRSWSVSYQLQVPEGAALSLRSLNGGIHLEDVSGDLNFTTTNGGLHLKNVGGKVAGRTTNGGLHVELTGTEWRGEGLDLVTTNGGIHVEVPRGYNAHLDLATTNGAVHAPGMKTSGSDDEEDGEDGSSYRRHRRRRTVNVDLGSGGRLLRLRTTNGGVHVGD
jgi:hypothetical protein